MTNEKPLKAQNMRWLTMLALVDLIIVIMLSSLQKVSEFSITDLVNWQLISTLFVPVLVLMLVNVLPQALKYTLVFWKPYGWLPGQEAFSTYVANDSRINRQTLQYRLGNFPADAREQNAVWYGIYQSLKHEPEIQDAHKHFLLYRDMATLSFLFTGLFPLSLYLLDVNVKSCALVFVLFLAQYFLTAISARWGGIRFVTSVLAIYASVRPN